MKITAEEAKNLYYAAVTVRAEETIKKAEPILDKIESEIYGAAACAMRENHIGLRSYMLNSEFPDLEMARNYIVRQVRKNGFTAHWDEKSQYVLIVKW